MSRTGWLDLSSGASGDMLLGALAGAGVPVEVFREAVAPLALPLGFEVRSVRRGGLAATQVDVQVADEGQPRRTWQDVRELLDRLPARAAGSVHDLASRVFAGLAAAEARVHGIPAEEVHFHEVGALDALADVVGTVAGVRALGLDRLVVSPVALGGGTARTEHGRLPVPVPAVLELLRTAGLPVAGGGSETGELCTPTGAALLAVLADAAGPLPSMTVTGVGVGAGGRDVPGQANVVRLVVGEATESASAAPAEALAREPALLIETNVDDLDPRLWPDVLATLLEAGAADAWLTPVLMKKGRPAHTLSVLLPPELAPTIRRLVFVWTSTLGVREVEVTKRPLARDVRFVDVAGERVAVKRGFLPDGSIATVQPEHRDVAAAAAALGLAPREVLARAAAAARRCD